MAAISVAFPIGAEKFEQARRWGQAKMGPRKAELAESDRQLGLSRESWHLQETSTGGLLILSFEATDVAGALAGYAAAEGPFERWEKQEIKALTGVDLGRPLSTPLPETLVEWKDS